MGEEGSLVNLDPEDLQDQQDPRVGRVDREHLVALVIQDVWD